MIQKEDIIKMVREMADVIIENEVLFCEFDSVAGDGDFGMSIAKGFKQLLSEWQELDVTTTRSFLKACSEVISENCGGASGPIWGAGFRGASKFSKDIDEFDMLTFGKLIESSALAIQKIGKAERGDKTLLDALLPCSDAIIKSANQNADDKTCLKAGAEAAVQGAENTKKMIASRGRASYVGERSLDHPDAGAMALGIIFTHIFNSQFN